MPTSNEGSRTASIHGRREVPGADGVEKGLDTKQPQKQRPASPNEHKKTEEAPKKRREDAAP